MAEMAGGRPKDPGGGRLVLFCVMENFGYLQPEVGRR